MLPQSPKVGGGCVFTRVSVFLSVPDISKSCGRIQTKLGGQVGCVTRTNRLDFGEDLDLDPDPHIKKNFFKRFFTVER